MGVLGTGENEAWIYSKSGQVPVAPIETASSLSWNRLLNDISAAEVNVLTGSHGDCCSVYGKIGTWGHSIVMFRDGERVWEGPITNIKWRPGGVTIAAKDVLAWGMVRRTPARAVTAPAFAVDELNNAIVATYAVHNPGQIVVTTLGSGTGPQVTRDVQANGGLMDDQYQELVKGGALFTVVGRNIVLWPNTTIIGRTAPLVPADHMTGDVEVEEDGFALATDTAAANDAGVVGTYSPGLDPFYGQVEQLVSSNGQTTASLSSVARQWQEQHYPAPLAVNVPAGSVLSCDAPFGIEELVAGTLVQVKVDGGMCKTVEATQQLSAVEVTSSSEGERVAVTLLPLSGVLT